MRRSRRRRHSTPGAFSWSRDNEWRAANDAYYTHGGSHSGNVSAVELTERGVLDILSSDYVPFSLLHAAFLLPERVQGVTLPASVALVTSNPANAVGLTDRGRIAEGLRADLVQVRSSGGVPVVRAVWREGRRVA